MQYDEFKLWIFDCDGVILDSNRMKREAFAFILSEYPQDCVQSFLEFQKTTFGLSRFRSIDAFFKQFLGREARTEEKKELLDRFGDYCTTNYPLQPLTRGAQRLLEALRNAGRSCYIASGSEQTELRGALDRIGIASFFRGIYGSPRAKTDLVADILAIERIDNPAEVLFLGDAVADFRAAQKNGATFIQIEDYTADPEGMSILREAEKFAKIGSLADIRL